MRKLFDNWYQYTGAMHMHTTDSDGTLPLEEVVEIGRRAGLEFMLFTDHMTLSHREQGKEGYYGKTLVLVGYEHNDTNDRHHYLLFESPRVYPRDSSVKEYVAAGAADGALGILAHPDEIRTNFPEHPPYPWVDWSADQFTGIELWNQMSEWLEKLTPWNRLAMVLSPRKSMIGPTERIMKRWDELNLKRKVVGIAGVDAHAFPIKVGPISLEIFPYKVHFRSLRCHILVNEKLSSDASRAGKQLYEAIRECRLFFSNMRWGVADDFEFSARNDSEFAVCGGSLTSAKNARLIVKLPKRATLKVIHNGQQIVKTRSDGLELNISEPGIYRVEAWKGKRGWIFSNHIRVGL